MLKREEETRFLTFSRFSWEQPWWIHRCNERMKNERQRSFVRFAHRIEENSFSGLAKPERIVNRDILISTVHYPPPIPFVSRSPFVTLILSRRNLYKDIGTGLILVKIIATCFLK